jgi:hypothetical protein
MEARHFLFGLSPYWADARQRVCDLAGVDPDALIEHVERKAKLVRAA